MNKKLRIAVISLLSIVLAVSIGFLAKDYCDSKNQAELYDNLIETVEEIDDTQDTMSYSKDNVVQQIRSSNAMQFIWS